MVWLFEQFISVGKQAIASATFWTALGSVGAVGALLFAGRQLFLTRKIEAYKLLCEDDTQFWSDSVVAERSALACVLLREPQNFALIEAHVHDVLGFFEDMGLMLRKGIAPLELVWCSSSHYILRYWPTLEWFIEEDRRRSHDPNYYKDFEYLHRRILRFETKKLGRPFVWTAALRQEFLEDEILLEIRVASEDDLEKLEEIESRSFTTDAFSFEDFEAAYQEQRTWFFVAHVLNEPVGYILGAVSTDGKDAEIESLAVEPEYRRCGIGERLLNHLLARLSREGVQTCRLAVATDAPAALTLYQRAEFTRTSTVAAYYSDGSDAYTMEKRLEYVGPDPRPNLG